MITKERLIQIIDDILAWGQEHDEEFYDCLLNAADITDEERAEMGFIYDYEGEEIEEIVKLQENMQETKPMKSIIKLFQRLHFIHDGDEYAHKCLGKIETELPEGALAISDDAAEIVLDCMDCNRQDPEAVNFTKEVLEAQHKVLPNMKGGLYLVHEVELSDNLIIRHE